MNNECIFCKIVAGQIPATRVYEDEDAIAFVDIAPVEKGHTLVIPKEHHDPIMETPDEILAKLIIVVRKIAKAQKKALNTDGINIAQANGKAAGQSVEHIHFHIIPRSDNHPNPKNWIPREYDSKEELEMYAQKIKNAIE